ncbi:hypothetical protein Efla_000774 [Eimeria flavescens]
MSEPLLPWTAFLETLEGLTVKVGLFSLPRLVLMGSSTSGALLPNPLQQQMPLSSNGFSPSLAEKVEEHRKASSWSSVSHPKEPGQPEQLLPSLARRPRKRKTSGGTRRAFAVLLCALAFVVFVLVCYRRFHWHLTRKDAARALSSQGARYEEYERSSLDENPCLGRNPDLGPAGGSPSAFTSGEVTAHEMASANGLAPQSVEQRLYAGDNRAWMAGRPSFSYPPFASPAIDSYWPMFPPGFLYRTPYEEPGLWALQGSTGPFDSSPSPAFAAPYHRYSYDPYDQAQPGASHWTPQLLPEAPRSPGFVSSAPSAADLGLPPLVERARWGFNAQFPTQPRFLPESAFASDYRRHLQEETYEKKITLKYTDVKSESLPFKKRFKAEPKRMVEGAEGNCMGPKIREEEETPRSGDRFFFSPPKDAFFNYPAVQSDVKKSPSRLQTMHPSHEGTGDILLVPEPLSASSASFFSRRADSTSRMALTMEQWSQRGSARGQDADSRGHSPGTRGLESSDSDADEAVNGNNGQTSSSDQIEPAEDTDLRGEVTTEVTTEVFEKDITASAAQQPNGAEASSLSTRRSDGPPLSAAASPKADGAQLPSRIMHSTSAEGTEGEVERSGTKVAGGFVMFQLLPGHIARIPHPPPSCAATVHSYYRLPVVAPEAITTEFSTEAAFSPRGCRALCSRLLVVRTLLAMPRLDEDRLFGSAMRPHEWFPHLVDMVPTDFRPNFPIEPHRPMHFTMLSWRLSQALSLLKNGVRPSEKETIELKRSLFDGELAPRLFKRKDWNAWREEDEGHEFDVQDEHD